LPGVFFSLRWVHKEIRPPTKPFASFGWVNRINMIAPFHHGQATRLC
jgi:hypothetical protein